MNRRRGGRNAGKSGRQGESFVEGCFIAAGLPVLTYKEYEAKKMFPMGPIAIKQYPVTHPYRPKSKRAGKNDFMTHGLARRWYIQVKNQNASGTTDEKLAFAFDYAAYTVRDDSFDVFLLVLLGDHWTPGMLDYCRNKCREFEFLNARVGSHTEAAVAASAPEFGMILRDALAEGSIK